MQAKLEFELPEYETEFRLAINGHKYKASIDEFLDALRSLIKYGNESEIGKITDNEIELVERLRGHFITILDRNGVLGD